MMMALVVWTLVGTLTAVLIAVSQHRHPERYTAEAAARRWARAEQNTEE